jgi:beta-galactosidase
MFPSPLAALVLTLLAGSTAAAPAAAVPARVTTSMDSGWRFLKAEAPGAEKPAFDDAAWRAVDVPHDWSIEGPYDEKNPTARGGGYLPSGVSWYRKHFALPAGAAGRRVFVEFDGVMANSEVWLNGASLGRRPYGYIGFRYELTSHLKPGARADSVLAVRTDTTVQPASRWYTGQGIYRHVRLVTTNPVHVAQWGLFVTTPRVTAEQALVHVQTTVVNQSAAARSIVLETALVDPEGHVLKAARSDAQSVPAGKSVDFQQDITVLEPKLWDLEHPRLYRAITRVLEGKLARDEETTAFGIRTARFDADTGFWLNDKNFKLKGVCLHHDGGALGAAVPSATWERRLTRLKQVGVNAIRTAHNPPSPEFLDLADRMGFIVMDETIDAWTVGKPHAEQGYNLYFKDWWEADTRDTVLRDRNHPSIVIYSAGNEIHDIPNTELAFKLFVPMRDLMHKLDPTRPVTLAVFRPNVSHVYDNGFSELMDVVGQNYRENELIAAHKQKPERKVVGTENGHPREVWLALRDNAFYSGQFIWSGVDYLGEADWPTVMAGSGVLDHTGAFRPRTYERQSWWSDTPMVHATRRVAAPPRQPTDPGYGTPERNVDVLFSDWNPSETAAHEENVEVYSNCDDVELWLNGQSLGSQARPADASARTWKVPYAAGVLKAVGRNKGQDAATHELRTAGAAARLLVSVDRSKLTHDWEDVVYAEVTVVDEHGVPVPSADDNVTFVVTGPALIAGVDNSDRASHAPFQGSQRRAYKGRCQAILRATAASGKITLSASAPGLANASVTLDAAPASRRP